MRISILIYCVELAAINCIFFNKSYLLPSKLPLQKRQFREKWLSVLSCCWCFKIPCYKAMYKFGLYSCYLIAMASHVYFVEHAQYLWTCERIVQLKRSCESLSCVEIFLLIETQRLKLTNWMDEWILQTNRKWGSTNQKIVTRWEHY